MLLKQVSTCLVLFRKFYKQFLLVLRESFFGLKFRILDLLIFEYRDGMIKIFITNLYLTQIDCTI